MTKTFEQYLQDKHFEIFNHILDDDLSDHFDHWLTTLDIDELIQYAEDWGKELIESNN